jgi:hypothetical protein
MSDDTIDIRDNTSGASKSVRTSSVASVHYPHHVFERAPRDDMVRGTAFIADTTSHSVIVAPANSPDLSYRNYICSVQVANKGGTAALVQFQDGAPASPDNALAFIYVPAGNTVTAVYDVPLRCSVATAFDAQADAASTIYVSAQGFVAP